MAERLAEHAAAGGIVRFDVRGKSFTTTLETIERYPDSYLAWIVRNAPEAVQSGRAIPINRKPEAFRTLLESYRLPNLDGQRSVAARNRIQRQHVNNHAFPVAGDNQPTVFSPRTPPNMVQPPPPPRPPPGGSPALHSAASPSVAFPYSPNPYQHHHRHNPHLSPPHPAHHQRYQCHQHPRASQPPPPPPPAAAHFPASARFAANDPSQTSRSMASGTSSGNPHRVVAERGTDEVVEDAVRDIVLMLHKYVHKKQLYDKAMFVLVWGRKGEGGRVLRPQLSKLYDSLTGRVHDIRRSSESGSSFERATGWGEFDSVFSTSSLSGRVQQMVVDRLRKTGFRCNFSEVKLDRQGTVHWRSSRRDLSRTSGFEASVQCLVVNLR